jgi:glycine/D-amino acid oxidase-like deaminating enzyme
MSRPAGRIAVLGAGIMGVCTALHLARRGREVTLFDAAGAPLSGASRWNEGKIHLGFLYSGDPSLRTAAHVLPGALQFRPLVEALLGHPIDEAVTAADDLYLCHRDSVVPPEAMADYYGRVRDLVRAQPDAGGYLADVSDCAVERLTAAELAAIGDPREIVAGFRVPERSVSTTWLADRFVAALAAEPGIEARLGSAVTAVRPDAPGDVEGRWRVATADGGDDVFDVVVNALWAGRMAIDATAGIAPAGIWSNRYRLSVFLRTREPVDLPCAIIATGPFGDIKNYNGRDFYLSWYPDGLRVDSAAVSPPPPAPLDEAGRTRLCGSILDQLERRLPGVARLRPHIAHMAPRGGWVFAAGQGSLSDPQASLHRRSDFGIVRRGAYVSVDTGKYATAPWLARRLAESIG